MQGQARINAFRTRLKELGWTEGRNLRIDYRWAADDPGHLLSPYAQELIGLSPDAILAGGTPATVALQEATRTIPIVFAQVTDPVPLGLVRDLARPGGNTTGFALPDQAGIAVKRLEMLKEIAPNVTRVAFIHDPINPGWTGEFAALSAAAPTFRTQVSAVPVHDVGEIERSLETFAREPGGGLIVFPSPTVNRNRDSIIALATRSGLPSAYFYRFFVAAGGLASYGIDNVELYRGAGTYVDRILRGEKPANLPVQLPTKFERVINVKTARTLGLTVPATLLATADELIE